MEIARHREEIDAIIPGVMAAYESIKTSNGMGIYTSNGAFYNHTFFGRDNAMAAKFVVDFDHQVALETIVALAALQGTKTDATTQESIGRIHHEFRDMTTWKGAPVERTLLRFFYARWGGNDKQLLTYYALDTTALFIRLVNKYAVNIDRSVLEKTIKNRSGESYTVAEAVVRASDWICSQVNNDDLMVSRRPNGWALPFQTFQDSSTAFVRTDGSLANFKNDISYTEVQAFSIDALEDATRLLSGHEKRHGWQTQAHAMRHALVEKFWNDKENFFGSAIDKKGLVDMPTVAAGWTLNTSLWSEVSKKKRQEMIEAIVTRLFSDDFLTPVGLRCRALGSSQPLPGVIEYHGRLSVWPMFSFMVIEGLRRHRLHKLAEQLENRVINGVNASGSFEEFFVVDGGGHMLKSVPGKRASVRVDAQMLPENNIAFTIIPSLVLAWRATNRGRSWSAPEQWEAELEDKILTSIDNIPRVKPEKAAESVPAVVPTKFRRFRGNIRSSWYFLSERRKM